MKDSAFVMAGNLSRFVNTNEGLLGGEKPVGAVDLLEREIPAAERIRRCGRPHRSASDKLRDKTLADGAALLNIGVGRRERSEKIGRAGVLGGIDRREQFGKTGKARVAFRQRRVLIHEAVNDIVAEARVKLFDYVDRGERTARQHQVADDHPTPQHTVLIESKARTRDPEHRAQRGPGGSAVVVSTPSAITGMK